MRRSSLVLLVIAVLATTAVGFASGAADPVIRNAPSQVALDSTTQANETSLLTEAALFDRVVDGDRSEYAAALYYVADNGTWYHATPNGSIGARAPHGDVVPNVDVTLENGSTVNETIRIEDRRRPVYVWKVTKTGCGTTVYDADSGDAILSMPVPSCDRHAPPQPDAPAGTPTASGGGSSQTPSATPSPTAEASNSADNDSTAPVTSPATANGPGFGVAATLLATLVAVAIAVRRRR